MARRQPLRRKRIMQLTQRKQPFGSVAPHTLGGAHEYVASAAPTDPAINASAALVDVTGTARQPSRAAPSRSSAVSGVEPAARTGDEVLGPDRRIRIGQKRHAARTLASALPSGTRKPKGASTVARSRVARRVSQAELARVPWCSGAR
jgi:hypothetical protein